MENSFCCFAPHIAGELETMSKKQRFEERRWKEEFSSINIFLSFPPFPLVELALGRKTRRQRAERGKRDKG
jgi:hypothetical protein